jgi:L-asparagine transporter-like permease
MRPLKKCVTSPRMTKTEGPNTGSFVKKIQTMMMNGMVIFIMAILLLMMLIPWQQNCRLPHGPHHTSHLSFLYMMGTQTRSSS